MATAAPAAKTVMYASTPQFQPPVTGEEICTSLGPVVHHVDAIVPKGRDTWEVHVTDRDVATGLEITGFRLRGRNIELSQRYPGGTWVRVRGFPLEIDNTKVDAIFKNFGAIVAGPFHATWRGTSVKTGDRTIKINLDKDIPQALTVTRHKPVTNVGSRDTSRRIAPVSPTRKDYRNPRPNPNPRRNLLLRPLRTTWNPRIPRRRRRRKRRRKRKRVEKKNNQTGRGKTSPLRRANPPPPPRRATSNAASHTGV